jgi:hypothetical protein
MAKKETVVQNKKEVVSKKHFVNPTDTWWGKAVVWFIIFGMVGLVILGFVLAIAQGNA